MEANVTPSDMRPGEDDNEKPAPAISADAGTDESIAERLAANPASSEAKLDRALDELMDASDPPASTQPVHAHSTTDLPESSGYDARAEEWLARVQHEPKSRGLIARLMSRLGIG